MSLHPKSTYWFESLVRRAQSVYALEALAATGLVELDQELADTPMPDTRELQDAIWEAGRLAERYAAWLPEPPARVDPIPIEDPIRTATESLAQVRGALASRMRLRRRRQRYTRRLNNLLLLRECVAAMDDRGQILLGMGRYSPFLSKTIFACPRPADDLELGDLPCIAEGVAGPDHHFHVLACLPGQVAAGELALRFNRCETVTIPEGLPGQWSEWPTQIDAEIIASRRRIEHVELAIDRLREDPTLAEAWRLVQVLRWYLEHTVTLTEDRQYCRITGWTSATDPQPLLRALKRAGVDATIVFRPPPVDRTAPVDAPPQGLGAPFRIFVDMLGTPGASEIDPSGLLSVLVPILFGFMFPDVGHGLVLALTSLVLSRRFPRLRFLIPCGFAGAGFGLLFGEVFGSSELLPALWIHPLDEPLTILSATVVIGVAVILLGLLLSGIEAHWRGELGRWLWQEGAVLTLYASALVAFFQPLVLLFTGLALIWYLTGSMVTGRGRYWRRMLLGTARLLHSAVQLALNTLSFMRVGAFAIAHAALSHTLLEFAGPIDDPVLRMLFLAVGHALLIMIEALVVFVQTTRLILFEFFTRFLRAEGRLFRPLSSKRRE